MLIFLCSSCANIPTSPASMIFPKYEHTINYKNNNIYVLGGLSYGKYLNTTEVYNIYSNQWNLANDLLNNRARHQSLIYNNNIMITGGINYDGAIKSVEALTFFGWRKRALLNYSRYSHNMFVLDDNLYVSGGYDSKDLPNNTTEKYIKNDDKWKIQSEMNYNLTESVSLTIKDKNLINRLSNHYDINTDTEIAIIIGGYELSGESNTIPSNKVELFDPVSNKWISIKTMKHSRVKHTAIHMNDYIYVIGGLNSPKSIERYNITTDEWTELSELKKGRYSHTTVVYNNIIYNIGGVDSNNNILKSMESFNTEFNMVYEDNPMINPRYEHKSILINDKIYVIGGIGNFPLNSIEYYNLDNGLWYSSHQENLNIDEDNN